MLKTLGYSSAKQSSQATSLSNLSMGGGFGSSNLSPFAQMLTQLQQLEQSNPGQYAKVSQQISSNLSIAASSAQTRGNSPLASQLTRLSKDFTTAAQTGQMPNVVDLAKAMQAGGYSGQSAADRAAVAAGTAANTAAAGSVPHHSGVLNFIQQALNLAGV